MIMNALNVKDQSIAKPNFKPWAEAMDQMAVSGNGLHAKPSFDYLLYLERRRTERSRRPFLLMLLNIEDLLSRSEDSGLVKKVEDALSCCIRETDIKGWHEQERLSALSYRDRYG